jgi:hydroxymethylglutaryl-CoA lyase
MSVQLRDVTLRDGLQNEVHFVPTDTKLALLQQLLNAGFTSLEVTSFVHPKWVPALQDADELAMRLPQNEGIEYRALIPNHRGMERFLAAPLHTGVFFLSASTAHNQANVNRTTESSLDEIVNLVAELRTTNRRIVGSIATSFVCPFEGLVPFEAVDAIAARLVAAGVHELAIADTIGQATPRMVYERCSRLREKYPEVDISLHLHDPHGYGFANVLAGMAAGIDAFDVAQAGLGGCPFAPGAPGNLAADTMHQFFEQQDIATGLHGNALASLRTAFQNTMLGGQTHAGIIHRE